jgi:DNA-binding transcriptional ArsR family regulator
VVAAATADAAGAAAPANDAQPGPRTPPRRRTAAVDTDALLAAVRAAPLCTMSDLEERTGADRAQLRAPLTRLIDSGIVIKSGRGRGTQYKLRPAPPEKLSDAPEASSTLPVWPIAANEEEE